MSRGVRVGVAAVVVALAVASGAPGAPAEERADFTFANGAEPRSLDPHVSTGQPEGRILDALFEGLMVLDPATLLPVPGVAREPPRVTDGGRTYTFRLRPDARWSDGTPVTAHDFAWSWRRLEDPLVASEYAYLHHRIEGALEFNAFERFAGTIEDVLTRLPVLAERHPGGVPAARWQEILAIVSAHEALGRAEAPAVRRLLALRSGVVPPEDLEAARTALVAEAARFRARFERARERYGRDLGVWAEDDHTLVVRLVAPTPWFLDVVAFHPSLPVPRHVVEQRGQDEPWFVPGRIVSNGPYRLAEWRPGERIRLVRSAAYPDPASVRLGIVDVLPVEGQAEALRLYLDGRIDWLPSHYPLEALDRLRERPDFYRTPGFVTYFLRFNTTRKPFDDPRVRRAVALAIDRNAIVELLGLGQLPAHHLVPPGLRGYEPPPSPLGPTAREESVRRARALLAEAGYPEGRGWPSGVGLLYNTHDAHRRIAEAVVAQVRRDLGIVVTPYDRGWQAYQTSLATLDYPMARGGWIGDYPDPETFLEMWTTDHSQNRTGWTSAPYDRLLAVAGDPSVLLADPEPVLATLKERERAEALLQAFARAPDEEARLAAAAPLRMHLLREAEAILVDELPVSPVYFYVVSGLVRPWVRGFHTRLVHPDGSTSDNQLDVHPLRGLWIDEALRDRVLGR
jgi:oligopeptide transport system substrate-binding protein